ncbi:MAG: hypothetical protein GEV28_05075 [Actinophytocola sp.]|nr:hypothetical protein [Actinophytocola sp.]
MDLVLDFLNTVDVGKGTDVLADEVAWPAWLAAHDLTAATGVLAARVALRSAVGDSPPAPSDLSTQVTVSLSADGPHLVAGDVVGAVLAAATRLVVRGEWDRIKICPAADCRWAFYDRSRNHSRTWCSMRVCGNREKARAWRERARAE